MADGTAQGSSLSTPSKDLDPALLDQDEAFGPLVAIIERAKARAYRSVNRELMTMYWDVGAHISAKTKTDGWGKAVIASFSAYVRKKLPGVRGFSPVNVWRMRSFYDAYSVNERLSTLSKETTWSNNILILAGAKTDEAREFYLLLAAKYNYGARELERQLDSGLFERTMLSNERTKNAVARHPQLAALRDSYSMEWLNLPRDHQEADIRRAIVAHLRDFMLEFGPDFSFIDQEFRVQVGMTDGHIDLLFYHRELVCLVAVELKLGRFRAEHLGQLNFYLEALDRDVRKAHENPSVGLILCTSKDDAVVEYSMSRSLSPAMVAEYQLHLPDKAILEAKLRELTEAAALELNEDQEVA